MKKLNFKRLAAVVAGGALLATAAAPLATAAFTDLAKDDLVNATGVPVVSVVGGANAAVSDFVWAGNIAARIAQMASKEMTVTQGEGGTGGTPTDLAVNVTVGGTLTYTGGIREYLNTALNSTSGTKEYYDNSVGNTYFTTFFNGTVNRTTDNNSTVSMSIIETIGITADGRFDPSTAKDLIAVINPSDMNYTVTFSPGISYPFTDSGSDDYVPVYFLGKSYLLDSINSTATQVVLIQDGADQTMVAGDTFIATGKDGKEYTVRFDDGSTAGTVDIAKFSLLDDQGAVVATINNATANGDLIFRINGVEVLASRIRIVANGIAKTTVNNTTVYSVQIVLGSGRVELQSGFEVPYDPSGNHTNIPWVASFGTSGTTLTSITIKNSNYFYPTTSPLYSVQSFGAATHDTEFEFFKNTGLDNVGTFKFQGFYDAGVQRSTVEFLKGVNIAQGTSGTTYGAIHYFDGAGQEHWVPMAIALTATQGTGGVLNFDGFAQSYWTSSPTDVNKFAVENDSSSLPISTSDYNVFAVTNDTNWDSSAIVQLKGRGGSKTYKYLAKKSAQNANQVWLLLVGGSQSSGDTTNYAGYIDTMQYNTGDIFLLGTSVNDANIFLREDLNTYVEMSDNNPSAFANGATDNNRLTRPFYWPDTQDHNNQTSHINDIYKVAVFKIHESTGTSDTTLNSYGSAPLITVLVDTDGGNSGLINTASIGGGTLSGWAGTLLGGPTGITTANNAAVIYAGTDQNLTFSEYTGSTSNYTKAFTVNGTKIEVGAPTAREVKFSLPNSAMKAYFTLQSNTVTTTTTGGESNDTPLGIGDIFTTSKGTKVTVTDITGTCAAGSGACTPATFDQVVPLSQNLVYTDQSAPSGKVIIVGGYYVNSLARGLAVSGGTIEDVVNAPGTYVAEKLANGNIIVAGYTASDTITAAQELIQALDDLMTA